MAVRKSVEDKKVRKEALLIADQLNVFLRKLLKLHRR